MTHKVDHPFIPDWHGDATWSAPGAQPAKFVTFEAGAVGAPFRIEHGRDMMFDAGSLVQDYNFIDYWFGTPDGPVHARYYLHDDHISVDLPAIAAFGTLDNARAAFPTDTLNYLQWRFGAILVLTQEGYKELWTAG